jgi:hypothetical protein
MSGLELAVEAREKIHLTDQNQILRGEVSATTTVIR